MISSAEALEKAKRMFMDVICAFYTDDEYIIADYLVRYRYLKDDEVQGNSHLKLHHKWARRAINNLLDGSLILSFDYHKRYQDAEGKVIKSEKSVRVFYVDYDQFIKVVYYRLHCIYQVQVSNDLFNRSCGKESLECSNKNCKRRYTLVEAVHYYNEETRKYYCRFCRSMLQEIEKEKDEEETTEMMQNKIKDQVDNQDEFHPSLLGYIEELYPIQIHEIDPSIVIKNELREQTKSSSIAFINSGGRYGGGGRRGRRDDGNNVEIEIKVVMDTGGNNTNKLTREYQSVPDFLIQSTVEETVQRQERLMKKEQIIYSDDEGCLSSGKGLFD